MFLLHETTQRRVCRVTFLLGCVLPMVLTVCWIVHWHRPWRLSDWQQMLQQRLHVRATVEGISSPRPGVTVLTDVRLADLRSGRLLGSIDRLSCLRREGRLTLQGNLLEIQSARLNDLVTAITTWLANNEPIPLELRAERLTIVSPTFPAVQLQGLLVSNDTHATGSERFQIKAQTEIDKTLQLTVDSTPQSLSCTMDMKSAPLPAWLVGTLVPGIEGCGDAPFTGELATVSENLTTSGNLRGRIEGVDLQAWVGTGGPHRLQGQAAVEFEQFSWRGKTINFAQGKLELGQGSCSYSLLKNAVDYLQCTLGPAWQTLRPSTLEEQIPFDPLALQFQISKQGISVAGKGDAQVLLSRGQTPMLLRPADRPLLAVSQLVQLMEYRQSLNWLPATQRAHKMAEKLPLPGGGTNVPRK